MQHILIGGAWPYANGSLHIGHLAGLLPGDVLARYHRMKGNQVLFVSGSDCHGTPVAIRAKQENKSPQEISDYYDEEFRQCFDALGFSYDVYTKTSSRHHINFVRDFHAKLYQSDFVYEKETLQAYCDTCRTFLADRFVVGVCPRCGEQARGDQCDACGEVLEPEQLAHPECAVCHRPVIFKKSRHLFIAISKLQEQLQDFVNSHPGWRKNAIAFTKRYIEEGLRDRALTRDLDWGIPVPQKGYEQKSIYIWAENVLGYLSASKEAVEDNEERFGEFWGSHAKHYYVHGKDNIPFHTIILPSLLIAHGGGWHLPDEIISSEYLTIEGRKISTSQNYAIWVKDIIKDCHPDSIRYYFLANGPEKRDADFTWREFLRSHNGELVGAYGNFVNRVLAFIIKYWNGVVPDGGSNPKIEERLEQIYESTALLIEKGAFREALREIFDLVRFANKYFDEQKPWTTRTQDEAACRHTLFWCVQIAANLAVLLNPFLPFSSEKVCAWFQLECSWHRQVVPAGYSLPEIQILFERIKKNPEKECDTDAVVR